MMRTPTPNPKPFEEMGVSGTAVYGGYVQIKERSADWIGWRKYMTSSDLAVNTSIVAAGLHYFCNLVAYPEWKVAPSDEKDQEACDLAKYMDEVIKKMNTPWYKVVRRAAMYRFHGFGVQEWTAKLRDDGLVGLQDIESRPQHTIEQWDVDEQGSIRGVWQRSPQTGALLGLPRSKLIYLVEDTLTDSPEGLGIFRHMADPYKRLKALQELEIRAYERDMRGIPIAKMPLAKLQEMVKTGVITEQQAQKMINDMKQMVALQVKQSDTGLVLDSSQYVSVSSDGFSISSAPLWDFSLLTGGAVGHAEIAAAIDRVQREIARIMGVEHLMMGDQGGNRALSEDKSRNLYLIANSVLKYISTQAQHDIINPLWALNGFPWEKRPTFETEDVTFKNAESVTNAIGKMAQAGAVLAPHDPVINDVRDLLGVSRVPDEIIQEQVDQQKQMQNAQQQALKMPPGLKLGQNGKGPMGGGKGTQVQGAKFPQGKGAAPFANGGKTKKAANGYANGHDVEKGYPEYNAAQERDMRTGRWSGGSGGLTGQDTAALEKALAERFPGHVVGVTPYAGGHEIEIAIKTADGRVQMGEVFLPLEQNRPLTFAAIFTTPDADGRKFAKDFLAFLHDAAIAAKTSNIQADAAGAGGYVWPKMGFELQPQGRDTVQQTVNEFLGLIKGRTDQAYKVLDRSDWRTLNGLLKAGGLDLPGKLANLDIDLTPEQATRISLNNRYLHASERPTLGKALLVGVTRSYSLPSSKYGQLKAWYERQR
jgi:hypothetical protein